MWRCAAFVVMLTVTVFGSNTFNDDEIETMVLPEEDFVSTPRRVPVPRRAPHVETVAEAEVSGEDDWADDLLNEDRPRTLYVRPDGRSWSADGVGTFDMLEIAKENIAVVQFESVAHGVDTIATLTANVAERLVDELNAINTDPVEFPLVVAEEAEIGELSVCLGKKGLAKKSFLNDSSVPIESPHDCFSSQDAMYEMEERHDVNVRYHVHKEGMFEEEDEEHTLPRASYGDFSTNNQLGRGGFKTVYDGYYKGRAVAIGIITSKVATYLTPEELKAIDDELTVHQAIREQSIRGKKLCRSYIPGLIAYYKRKPSLTSSSVSAFYIIMELGSGDIYHKEFDEPNTALGVAFQLLYGLICVHTKGYIHKDIKPLNTLRSSDGVFLWTNDFGLAAATDDPTELARLAGTPRYMPHESAAVSGLKYDVYALGLSFRELKLTDHLPAGMVASMVHKFSWDKRKLPVEYLDLLVKFAMGPLKDEVKAQEGRIPALKRSLETAEAALAQATKDHADAIVLSKQRPPRDLEKTLEKIRFKMDEMSEYALNIDRDLAAKQRDKVTIETELTTQRKRVADAQRELETAQERARLARLAVDLARETRSAAHSELERAKSLKVYDPAWYEIICMDRGKTVTTAEKERLCSQAKAALDDSAELVKIKKREMRMSDEEVEAARGRLETTRAEVALIERDRSPAIEALNGKITRRIDALAQVNKDKGKLEVELNELAGRKRRVEEAQRSLVALEDSVRRATASRASAMDAVRRAEAALAALKDKEEDITNRLMFQNSPDDLMRILMRNDPLLSALSP